MEYLNSEENLDSRELSNSSSGDFIMKPVSQVLLKKLTISISDIYSYVQAKHKRQLLNELLTPGNLLRSRYRIIQTIGKGSFGKVSKAWDEASQVYVAVKVIKQSHTKSTSEIEHLKILNLSDEKDLVVKLLDHFEVNGFTCIVLEYLHKTLFTTLRENFFKGFSVRNIRLLGWQLLQLLELLSKEHLVHCDLKPENIMLTEPDMALIKAIDLGSSCFSGSPIYKYVQSRYYRAPEVLLELPYHQGIDMWSLGCILAELHLGHPLFCGSNRVDQMGKIVEVLGMPPNKMIRNSRVAADFFKMRPRFELRFAHVYTPKANLREVLGIGEQSELDYLNFLDLVQRMLEFDPEKRVKPQEAMQHLFFAKIHGGKLVLDNRAETDQLNSLKINKDIVAKFSPVPWPANDFPFPKPKNKKDPFSYQISAMYLKGRKNSSASNLSSYSKQSTEVSRSNSLYHSPQCAGSSSVEEDLKPKYLSKPKSAQEQKDSLESTPKDYI